MVGFCSTCHYVRVSMDCGTSGDIWGNKSTGMVLRGGKEMENPQGRGENMQNSTHSNWSYKAPTEHHGIQSHFS